MCDIQTDLALKIAGLRHDLSKREYVNFNTTNLKLSKVNLSNDVGKIPHISFITNKQIENYRRVNKNRQNLLGIKFTVHKNDPLLLVRSGN